MLKRFRWVGEPAVESFRALHRPRLAWRIAAVQRHVPCPHTLSELLTVAQAVLERRSQAGEVAELGCFKGGSTARLSLVCADVGKRLLVFDSFEGLPEPEPGDAEHEIQRPRTFKRGEYAGTLEEVRENVRAHGELGVCEFVPGWLADSLAEELTAPISVAFVDVDLVASTRDAIEGVWPRVVPGGIVFVHDATDPKLAALLRDQDWWRSLGATPRDFALPAASDPNTLAWFLR